MKKLIFTQLVLLISLAINFGPTTQANELSASNCKNAAPTKAGELLHFKCSKVVPENKETNCSEALNGLAYMEDKQQWACNSKSSVGAYSKFQFQPIGQTVSYKNRLLPGTNVRCGHLGGSDYYRGELFIAMNKCSDGQSHILVLDSNFHYKRSAVIPVLKGEFPWASINPLDDRFFYAAAADKYSAIAFERNFLNNATLNPVKQIYFDKNPQDHTHNNEFWSQGLDFGNNGLIYRVVDVDNDEFSVSSGIWVYEIEHPIQHNSVAKSVGFIPIKYDPDQYGYRRKELEDIDITTIPGVGDIHVQLLDNQFGDTDNMSIFHYQLTGDVDRDGVKDLRDNCLRRYNPGQEDSNRNHVGDSCEKQSVFWLSNGDILVKYKPKPLIRLCPQHIGGDREFNGNGPIVTASARLYVLQGNQLWAEVYFDAKETVPDWTHARKKWNILLASAPGYQIVDLSPRTSFAWFVDRDTSTDKPFVLGRLVSQFIVNGDTGGNDVKNCTNDDAFLHVYFNPVNVTIRRK